jgi:hypothetical protein
MITWRSEPRHPKWALVAAMPFLAIAGLAIEILHTVGCLKGTGFEPVTGPSPRYFGTDPLEMLMDEAHRSFDASRGEPETEGE